MTCQRLCALGVRLAAVSVGFCVVGWNALMWHGSFQGDESIYGIMARDILSGARPLFVYGIPYGGSLISYLAAPFVWISGYSVPGMRAVAVLLFTLLLILQGYLVERRYGSIAAICTTLFASVPSVIILYWVSQLMPGVDLYACISTAMLLLFTCTRPTSVIGNRLRWLCIGGLCGIAFWLLPLNLLYIVPVLFLTVLRSDEWKRMRMCMDHLFSPLFGDASKTALNAIGVLSIVLIIANYAYHNAWMSIGYIVLAILMALSLFSTNIRSRLADVMIFATGFLVGCTPYFLAKISGTLLTTTPFELRLPTTGSIYGVFHNIVPSLAGVSFVAYVPLAPLSPRSVITVLLLLGILIAFLTFAWKERTAFADILLLRSPSNENLFPALLLLLACVPLFPLAGLAITEHSMTRYAIPSWQAIAMIVGIQTGNLLRKHTLLFLCCAAIWGTNAYYTLSFVSLSSWNNSTVLFAPQRTKPLLEYLAKRKVHAGYADYWIAHPLTYISKGQLLLAADNYSTRDMVAEQAAETSETFVLIFSGNTMHPNASIDTPQKLMKEFFAVRGWTDPALAARLPTARLLERKTIDIWEIWILQAPLILRNN